MGLLADISSLVPSLAASIPDAARAVTHGPDSAVALSASSRGSGYSDISEDGVEERSRLILRADDLPMVREGECVEIVGVPHVVTSLQFDPVGATKTVGVSAPFSGARLNISGKRRDGNAVLTVSSAQTVFVLPAESSSGVLSPANEEVCRILFRDGDFVPAVGDTVADHFGNAVRVRSVTRVSGAWLTVCSGRRLACCP